MSAAIWLATAAAPVTTTGGELLPVGVGVGGLIAAAGFVARAISQWRNDNYSDMRRQRDEAIQERNDARKDADERLRTLEQTVTELRVEIEGLRRDQGDRDDTHRGEMRAQEDRHRTEMRAAEERHRTEMRAMQDQNLHVTQRNYAIAEWNAQHGWPLPPDPEEDDHG